MMENSLSIAINEGQPTVDTGSNASNAIDFKASLHAIIYSSSSEAEGDEANVDVRPDGAGIGTTRPSSPPPKCAICLSRFKNKCFTDSCMHQFCFKCLCEWSKVKPECPLCKQVFKSIIHNVRANDQYDRYEVQCNARTFSRLFGVNVVASRDFILPFFAAVRDRNRVISQYTGLGVEYLQMILSGSNLQTDYESYAAALLNYYRQDTNPRPVENTIMFLLRRFIYEHRAMAMPLPDPVSNRYRESNASFYRSNPAQTHRLMAFAHRDLTILLLYRNFRINQIMQIISDILPVFNIPSEHFKSRLMPFLGIFVTHFVHELNNFARSTYDMEGYDRNVCFSAPFAIVRLPAAANMSDYATSLPVSEGADVSISSSSSNTGFQSTAINLSIRNGDIEVVNLNDLDANAEAAANAEVAAINTGNTNEPRNNRSVAIEHIHFNLSPTIGPISETIVLSSPESSSSDCEFVLERKPPHLRTPEYVSLNSESDSDVVFVEENKPEPTNVEQSNRVETTTTTEQLSALAAETTETYDGPSTSTGRRSTIRRAHESLSNKIDRRRSSVKRKRLSTFKTFSESASETDTLDSEYKPTTSRSYRPRRRKIRSQTRKSSHKEPKRRRTTNKNTNAAERSEVDNDDDDDDDDDDEEEKVALSALKDKLTSNTVKENLPNEVATNFVEDQNENENESSQRLQIMLGEDVIQSTEDMIVYEDESGLEECGQHLQNDNISSTCYESLNTSTSSSLDTIDTVDSDDIEVPKELCPNQSDSPLSSSCDSSDTESISSVY